MSHAPLAIPTSAAAVPQCWSRLWLPSLSAPMILGPAWIAGAQLVAPGNMLGTLAGFVLVAVLAAGSYCDLRWRRIPNWATYSAVLWALAVNVAAGVAVRAGAPPDSVALLGAIGLAQAALGMALCFGLLLAVYSCGGSGAGDVKLAAAIGALLGPQLALTAVLWCYLSAGTALVAYLVYRYGAWSVTKLFLRRFLSFLVPGHVQKPSAADQEILATPVPMAVFFAIGTVVALTQVWT